MKIMTSSNVGAVRSVLSVLLPLLLWLSAASGLAVQIENGDIIVLSVDGYYRIDPATRATTKIMNVHPIDLAAEPDGDLLILSRETPPQIYHVDSNTNLRTVLAAGSPGTNALAFSSIARGGDGSLYLIEPKVGSFSGNLYKVDLILSEPVLLGTVPYATKIEVAPDGFIHAFHADVGDDLFVVDPSDGTYTTLSVTSGLFPGVDRVERILSIAFAPNGEIYAIGKRVGSAVEGTLVRIDPETGTQQEIVSVAGEIMDGADLVRADSGDFYVSSDEPGLADTDLVYEIDGVTGAVTPLLNGEFSAFGASANESLVLGPNGDLLLVTADYGVPFGRDLTGNTPTVIVRVDPTLGTRSIEAGQAPIFGVRQLALEPSGTMVGTLINSPNPQRGVVRFNLETGEVNGITQDDIITDPVGIAADPTTGDLFVSDKDDDEYIRIDPNSGAQELLGTLASQVFTGGGLAFDTIDNSLVSTLPLAFGTPGVVRFANPGGSNQVPVNVAVGAPFTAPAFVTLGPNGDIFVADVNSHSVLKVIRATGSASTLTTGPPFVGLGGLAYSESLGALLVADQQGGVIYKVDPTTGGHSIFVDIDNFPDAPILKPVDLIVVDAVPEPSIGILQLAAFAILVWVARRAPRVAKA